MDHPTRTTTAQSLFQLIKGHARAATAKVTKLDLTFDAVKREIQNWEIVVTTLRPLLEVVVERVDRDHIAMHKGNLQRRLLQEFKHGLDAWRSTHLRPIGLEAKDATHFGAGMSKRVVTKLHDGLFSFKRINTGAPHCCVAAGGRSDNTQNPRDFAVSEQFPVRERPYLWLVRRHARKRPMQLVRKPDFMVRPRLLNDSQSRRFPCCQLYTRPFHILITRMSRSNPRIEIVPVSR